ncbi:hypothetical protein MXB_1944, partial [Myxobolus squamalis]
SPEPLYVDVAVVLTQNSIFAWHNIIFSVAKIEYWEGSIDPNIGYESLEALVKYFTKINSKFDSHVVFGNNYRQEAVALIKTSAYLNDASMAAYVVAHEIGHNLGFSHADSKNNLYSIRFTGLQLRCKRLSILPDEFI